jgi:hypothetical protein
MVIPLGKPPSKCFNDLHNGLAILQKANLTSPSNFNYCQSIDSLGSKIFKNHIMFNQLQILEPFI